MSGVTTGPLTPQELPRAAEIQATAPEAWSLSALEEEQASPCGRLYGLWQEGRLVGTAVFQLILDGFSRQDGQIAVLQDLKYLFLQLVL